MDELLQRFQTRLNHLTNSILTDHQSIEKIISENFYNAPFINTL